LKRVETSLPDVWVIEPRVLNDARGFFIETYHRDKYAALGITDDFVQDNHSRSSRGVLRGLHYQLQHPQAKLCRVIEGEVLDVAVDIRSGSPTFGKCAAVVLSAAKHNQIYIPAGFAHGFAVLSEFYDQADERGVAWNDPALEIAWNISSPLLSEKDLQNPRLSEVPQRFLPEYRVR
jgi:dTDP-4-dehydrorhamnose 3,5-epimerase